MTKYIILFATDEVWLDDDLSINDRKFVLIHELRERSLMAKGMSYAQAHNRASVLEFHCRRHPEELDELLNKELEHS